MHSKPVRFCPRCGSTDVRRLHRRGFLERVFLWLRRRRPYRCEACDKRFLLPNSANAGLTTERSRSHRERESSRSDRESRRSTLVKSENALGAKGPTAYCVNRRVPWKAHSLDLVEGHLRHSNFAGLRVAKSARSVVKEHTGGA